MVRRRGAPPLGAVRDGAPFVNLNNNDCSVVQDRWTGGRGHGHERAGWLADWLTDGLTVRLVSY